MKKYFILLLAGLTGLTAFSQNVGIGTVTPDPTAILDLSATGKGILVPRMDSATRNAIAGPARGLLVYDSSCRAFFVNRGTADNPDWKQLLSIADGWGTRGNTGTDTAINFIGPADNMPLHLAANGMKVIKLNAANATYYFGKGAGRRNVSGNNNIAVGDSAMAGSLTASQSIALGQYSMKDATGGANIGIGNRALQLITGSNNIGIGNFSLQMAQQGYNNIGIGQSSLANNNGGNDNTGIGHFSLYVNKTGKYNTALGNYSLFNNDSTNNNTAVGYYALTNARLPGGNNTAVGTSAAWQLEKGSDNTALGYFATPNTHLFTVDRYNSSAIGAYAMADCNNCLVLGSVAGVNGGSSNIQVGIGITTPAYTLDVRSPDNNVTLAHFRNGSGYGQIYVSNGTGRVDLGVDENGGYAGTNLPGDFRIRTGATNRMFFRQSDGYIGIGTLNPSAQLSVYSAQKDVLQLESGSVNGTGLTLKNGNAPLARWTLQNGQNGKFRILLNDNAVPFTIDDQTQFVGIGTDNPSEKLELAGNLKLSGTILTESLQSFFLINNWVNYGAGFGIATYYRDKQNIIRLAGLVKNGTSPVVATLPPAYRPAAELIFTIVSGTSFARLDIRQNGDVELIGPYSNAYVSLDGIAFRVN